MTAVLAEPIRVSFTQAPQPAAPSSATSHSVFPVTSSSTSMRFDAVTLIHSASSQMNWLVPVSGTVGIVMNGRRRELQNAMTPILAMDHSPMRLREKLKHLLFGASLITSFGAQRDTPRTATQKAEAAQRRAERYLAQAEDRLGR